MNLIFFSLLVIVLGVRRSFGNEKYYLGISQNKFFSKKLLLLLPSVLPPIFDFNFVPLCIAAAFVLFIHVVRQELSHYHESMDCISRRPPIADYMEMIEMKRAAAAAISAANASLPALDCRRGCSSRNGGCCSTPTMFTPPPSPYPRKKISYFLGFSSDEDNSSSSEEEEDEDEYDNADDHDEEESNRNTPCEGVEEGGEKANYDTDNDRLCKKEKQKRRQKQQLKSTKGKGEKTRNWKIHPKHISRRLSMNTLPMVINDKMLRLNASLSQRLSATLSPVVATSAVAAGATFSGTSSPMNSGFASVQNIFDLPLEILDYLVSNYLSRSDQIRLRKVCKSFYYIVENTESFRLRNPAHDIRIAVTCESADNVNELLHFYRPSLCMASELLIRATRRPDEDVGPLHTLVQFFGKDKAEKIIMESYKDGDLIWLEICDQIFTMRCNRSSYGRYIFGSTALAAAFLSALVTNTTT